MKVEAEMYPSIVKLSDLQWERSMAHLSFKIFTKPKTD